MAEPLFPRMLLDALARDPDRVAFEHGARVVSCGGLLELVRRLVAGMRAAGLKPGRGVATVTGVTPEAFAANVAAHALGCRVVGIRPLWNPSHVADVLAAGVDALVGDASTLTSELLALDALPPTLLSLGAHPPAVDLLAPRPAGDGGDASEVGEIGYASEVGEIGDAEGDRPITVEARPDDVARLNFTSGTTGRPKGCARTYRTFSLAYRPDRWAPDLARLVARCERFLAYGSWSIPVMLTFAGRSLITGGTVVIGDDGDDMHADLASAIARHRITGVAMTVPSLHGLLRQLHDTGRPTAHRNFGRNGPIRAAGVEVSGAPSGELLTSADLGCLGTLIVTGSPAGPGLLTAAVDRLGPVVWQGYGQAESGMISLLTPDDVARHPDTALASVGRPLPEVEISVRHPSGRPLGPGQTGEICVRSPHVMDGYWDQAGDETATATDVIEAGWLHTRDLGHLDPALGLLHLTGRSRDVIIVNGEVCYAGAIEQVLARHPDVAQAYVVGVPDERTGEAVHAFVVPTVPNPPTTPTTPATPGRRAAPAVSHEALAELVRSELTVNHVPETITVVDEVPVAPGGKPDKQALVTLVPR